MKQSLWKVPVYTSAYIGVVLAAAGGSYSNEVHALETQQTQTVEGEILVDSAEQAIAPIVFRDGSTHLRSLENVNGVAIAEGDIIFGDAERYFSQNNAIRNIRGLGNFVYGTVWPNGVAPYQIGDNLSPGAAEKVRSAIARWNETGAINLIERTDATASAYPNYIYFEDRDQCASWVGFQNNGPQSVYTGDTCSEGSMIHEIGHALGLLHEHTRPDRDSFVQVNWNSIDPDKTHNFDILEDSNPLGEYDYESIMHYGSHFFSNDGAPTITSLQAGVNNIGQRQFISDGDRASMIELYQSEYSLTSTSPTSAEAGGTVELDMFVTNNSTMGANTLRLEAVVPADTSLISFSSAAWACQQNGVGDNVVCESPALTESSSSSVSVTLTAPATEGEISFATTLSANTHDTDPSNNEDNTSTTIVAAPEDLIVASFAPVESEPAIAAATQLEDNTRSAPTAAAATPQATSSVASASSGGGGSFAAFGLLMLLVRRRVR